MNFNTLSLFAKTSDNYLLRITDSRDKIAFERSVLLNDVNQFYEQAEKLLMTSAIQDFQAVGSLLYDWIDGPTNFFENLLQGERELHLQLSLPSELQSLPWELLHNGEGYLTTNLNRPFSISRLVSSIKNPYLLANRPLRLLFMASSPEDEQPLNFEIEETMIVEACRKFGIDLVVEESGTIDGLKETLSLYGIGYFDVVHVSGHAGINGNIPCFVMEDELGLSHYINATDFAATFSGYWPKLVFLSGCETASSDGKVGFHSLCESLVYAGISFVTGWSNPVGDWSATRFASYLYEKLSAGLSLNTAMAQARRRLFDQESSNLSFSQYWHLLRLYHDATEMGAFVTAPKTVGRLSTRSREAHAEFLDAGSKIQVCPRSQFVGRRRSLQRCLRVLKSMQGEEDYREGLFIFGMGGLGKSSLAARLCDRLSDYGRIVNVGKIDNIEMNKILLEQCGDNRITSICSRFDSWKHRFKKMLETVFTMPTLFIFDDFEINLKIKQGKVEIEEQARSIVQAILMAIRETNNSSKVIITSRYLFEFHSSVQLHYENLTSVRSSDLDKKLSFYSSFEDIEENVRDEVLSLIDGNFLLIDRFDAILSNHNVDRVHLNKLLRQEVTQFQKDFQLQALLLVLPKRGRELVAFLSLFGIAVNDSCIEAIVPTSLYDEDEIKQAVSLGIVENYKERGENAYYVPQLVKEMVAGEISLEQREEAQYKALNHFYKTVWNEKEYESIEEIMELHRIALLVSNEEIANEVGLFLATWFESTSQYRLMENLCKDVIEISEDYRLYHKLAIAERFLGKTQSSIEHYKKSLELLNSLHDSGQQYKDEKASILSNFAEIQLYSGEVYSALNMAEEAYQFFQKNSDLNGMAAALNIKSHVAYKKGDTELAKKVNSDITNLIMQSGNMSHLSVHLNTMGIMEYHIGNREYAERLWNQAYQLSKETGNQRSEANSLNCLSGLYAGRGEVTTALKLLHQALEIQSQLGDLGAQASTQNNIASLLQRTGHNQEAIKIWGEAYKINEKIGRVDEQATNLNNMASALELQGETAAALQNWDKSLRIYEKTMDKAGQSSVLNNMAQAIKHTSLQEALKLLRLSLRLSIERGDKEAQAVTLSNISGIVEELEGTEPSLTILNQALELQKELNDFGGQAITLDNMAGKLELLGDSEQAIILWNQSLLFHEKVGNMLGKAAVLSNMAGLVAFRGDTVGAKNMLNESLAIQRATKEVDGEAFSLSEMADLLLYEGQVDEALLLWSKSLTLYKNNGNVHSQAKTLYKMGEQLYKAGHNEQSLVFWQQSIPLFILVGDNRRAASALWEISIIFEQSNQDDKALETLKDLSDICLKLQEPQRLTNAYQLLSKILARQKQDSMAIYYWEKALPLYEEMEEWTGWAVTQLNIASLKKNQGNWSESIPLLEKVLLKAVDLSHTEQKSNLMQQILLVIHSCPDFEAQRKLYRLCINVHFSAGARFKVVDALFDMGLVKQEVGYLAQALWLSLIWKIPDKVVSNLSLHILESLGLDHSASPHILSTAYGNVLESSELREEKLLNGFLTMFQACAEIRNISEVDQWLEQEQLLNFNAIKERVIESLELLIGDGWLIRKQDV